jgi:hypothetical protein
VGGYDLSGHARKIGPLSCIFQEGADDPLNASIIGTWLGQAAISPGTLNGIFDTTALTGIHALLGTPGTQRNVLVAQGIRAVPAIGDPTFCGQFQQDDYIVGPGETPVIATIKFSPTSGVDMGATTSLKNYNQPWGILLHTNVAATAAYTGTGINNGDDSHLGGYMMYQVTTAAGAGYMTATIKVQDSTEEVNGSYGDLLSSGVINCGTGGDTAVPISGVVALAATATVKQFVRWQILLGTATSVTFVLSFVRG